MISGDTLQSGLDRIRIRFLEKLEQREARLITAIQVARESPSRRERIAALEECQLILHKLAGTAGTMGFAELGEGARFCEERVRACLNDEPGAAEFMHEMLDRFMEGIAALPERRRH